jgi:hypothetical protein
LRQPQPNYRINAPELMVSAIGMNSVGCFLPATETGRYAHCEKSESAIEAVIPYVVSQAVARLHLHCWGDWHQARQAKAVTALAAIGVEA